MAKRAFFLGVPLALFVAGATLARADGGEVGAGFFVSKTENRNQVHYAVRVDGACVPLGTSPVRAYWRTLERGPDVTEPLLPREEPAYGIAWQRVVSRSSEGGTIDMALRAFPRKMTVQVARTAGGGCVATTSALVAGYHSELRNIHVVLRFLGIESAILSGFAKGSGRPVREVIRP